MNYTSASNPPRGEIWIRGPSITKGYFNNNAKTDECFRDGWLLTGDVGEWHEDGTLAVIDRIKNITKLSHGECPSRVIPLELRSAYLLFRHRSREAGVGLQGLPLRAEHLRLR